MVVPVIDLFAGPGGLSEGFEMYRNSNAKAFRCVLSIEKEKFAHQTLLLRAFFRSSRDLPKSTSPTFAASYRSRSFTVCTLVSTRQQKLKP